MPYAKARQRSAGCGLGNFITLAPISRKAVAGLPFGILSIFNIKGVMRHALR